MNKKYIFSILIFVILMMNTDVYSKVPAGAYSKAPGGSYSGCQHNVCRIQEKCFYRSNNRKEYDECIKEQAELFECYNNKWSDCN